jgi:hypothetical protein
VGAQAAQRLKPGVGPQESLAEIGIGAERPHRCITHQPAGAGDQDLLARHGSGGRVRMEGIMFNLMGVTSHFAGFCYGKSVIGKWRLQSESARILTLFDIQQ